MHVRWAKVASGNEGGEADVIALDGDRITVLSTTPSAPGSRPEGTLIVSGMTLRMKVARCRRQDADEAAAPRYVIDGRLLDVTREARADLRRLVDGASP